MRNHGGSSQPGDIEKHFKVCEGKVVRTGFVRGAAKVKTFETHWDSTKLQSELPRPGLLPLRLDLLPRVVAAAAAPTPRSSS